MKKKEALPVPMSAMQSKCCGGGFETIYGGEGTNFFECKVCGHACDLEPFKKETNCPSEKSEYSLREVLDLMTKARTEYAESIAAIIETKMKNDPKGITRTGLEYALTLLKYHTK